LEPRPIVSRGGWLRHLRWTPARHRAVDDRASSLLLVPPEGPLSRPLRNEIERAEAEGLDRRSHCARRQPWYCLRDLAVPDFFLPYMGARPPHVVLNASEATCSNAIHRLWRLPDTSFESEALVAGSLTTLFRLSSELSGRSYGGGVLKLEPRGVGQLRLPVAGLPGLLSELEEVIEEKGPEEASRIADERLLVARLGMSSDEVATLFNAAQRLRELRHK
jgi:hypothetical protein